MWFHSALTHWVLTYTYDGRAGYEGDKAEGQDPHLRASVLLEKKVRELPIHFKVFSGRFITYPFTTLQMRNVKEFSKTELRS